MKTTKILIVEDEPIIAADLEQELKGLGYQVLDTLESGEDAIAFVQEEMPDLILMDIQLEGHLDGIDTAHEILKHHALPIIFLTSNTDEKSFTRARLTQPFAFLSKPFRIADLKHSIALAIAEKETNLTAEEEDEDEVWFDDRIFIKTKEWMVKIQVDDLLWIEADSCYCTLKTKDKEFTIVSTLKKFSEQVTDKNLMRVHRSFIVNLNKIDKLNDSHISISKKIIPIGRTYKESVQKLFRRF